MNVDFEQISWDSRTEDDCRQLIRLAVREDLGRGLDLTTVALVPFEAQGSAELVVRRAGVIAGLPAAQLVIDEMQLDVRWQSSVLDGTPVAPGTAVAQLSGSARDLLTAERIMLNFVGRLSGIATLTRQYVEAVAGTATRVYDTRKTTPGWRRLEKYAVRQGGGSNHRTGLSDAVLIKDNHLAQVLGQAGLSLTAGEALQRVRDFLENFFAGQTVPPVPIEIEVDNLDQLKSVLPLQPDLVLLDNMTLEQLRQAVQLRDASGAVSELEASGGVTLQNIREVAETGVNRISVGALTHSAVSLDVGLDWSVTDGQG